MCGPTADGLIPGAGHLCWEEKPAEYAALVADWWANPKAV
jgi:pimeloyl-ACP methyl ester carboxylesterase